MKARLQDMNDANLTKWAQLLGPSIPTRFVSTNTNDLFQSIWGDLSLAVAVRKFGAEFPFK
jgi:hypothetical protein